MSTDDLQALAGEVEAFLLAEKRWVSAAELEERFGMKERAFRQVGEKPGLCTLFAISGDRGYRHVACASPKEWERFQTRQRQHSIGQLVRVRRLRKLRQGLAPRQAELFQEVAE